MIVWIYCILTNILKNNVDLNLIIDNLNYNVLFWLLSWYIKFYDKLVKICILVYCTIKLSIIWIIYLKYKWFILKNNKTLD